MEWAPVCTFDGRTPVRAQLLNEFPPVVCPNENITADDACLVRVCPMPDPDPFGAIVNLSLRVYPADEAIPRIPDETIQPVRFGREGFVCSTYEADEFPEDPQALYLLLDQVAFPRAGTFRVVIDVGVETLEGWEPPSKKWIGQLKVAGTIEVTASHKGKGKQARYRSKLSLCLVGVCYAAGDNVLINTHKQLRTNLSSLPRSWPGGNWPEKRRWKWDWKSAFPIHSQSAAYTPTAAKYVMKWRI